MPQEIDARGLTCPQPVINTKKALDQAEAGEFITIVDNEIARDNVLKLVASQGCQAVVESKEGGIYITITKGKGVPDVTDTASQPKRSTAGGDTVVMITSQFLGQGEEELGKVLMRSYLYTLVEADDVPRAILLANSGAFLSCQGSTVLEHLEALANKGAEILTCGTCLDYYNLKDKLIVGQVTNMYTITEQLKLAGKVINI
ncbi:MAG TPA: sulfurtransferase-like selenium metabolism protein YedF [Bacillota bacterium]|nr:sulfurtransferase-like selenium metabolism protein YedF [Bacillota bacterium]